MKWWIPSNQYTLALAVVKELGYDSNISECSHGARFTVPSGLIEKTITFLSARSIKFHTGFEGGEIIIYILKQ